MSLSIIRKIKHSLFILLGILFLGLVVGCADDDSKKKTTDPLAEIKGEYTDDFGGSQVITDTTWTSGDLSFTIQTVNQTSQYLVAQNAATNAYSPELFSRFDWTISEDVPYFCQSAYDKATAVEAEAVESADRADLTTDCNDFG